MATAHDTGYTDETYNSERTWFRNSGCYRRITLRVSSELKLVGLWVQRVVSGIVYKRSGVAEELGADRSD